MSDQIKRCVKKTSFKSEAVVELNKMKVGVDKYVKKEYPHLRKSNCAKRGNIASDAYKRGAAAGGDVGSVKRRRILD